MRLFKAWAAAVFRYEGQLISMAAARGGLPGSADAVMAHLQVPHAPTEERPEGRTALTRTIQHVVDVDSDMSWGPRYREDARARGFRSYVSVPMLRGDVVVGVIGVSRQQVGGFALGEISLLQTFADQAVIAIENVRLFTELQASNRDLTTALDKQTATAEILRVISQSQTDVQPVFDAILASAVRLLGAYSGVLTRIAGDQIVLAALTSTDDAGDAATRALFPQALQSELSKTGQWDKMAAGYAQVIGERAPLNIADVHTDPRWPETARAYARLRGYRSWAAVPMIRRDEAIGTISVTRSEAGGFTDDEIALLKTFADQAVIAIENVRLFTELQEKNTALTTAHAQVTDALEHQTATSEILSVISSSPTDVQPVFDTIVRNAVRLCGALYGAVTRTEGDLIHLAAQYNLTPDQADALRLAYPIPLSSNAPVPRSMRTGTVYRAADVEAEPEWQSRTEEMRTTLRSRGVRSHLSVPMLRGGIAIGAIILTHREVGAFSDAHVELAKTFADQAVIAVENTRLFNELQARTAELTRSVDELMALGEVSRALSSTLDLETVLQTIVTRAVEIAGTAGCTIWEYDAARAEFRLRASYYADQADVALLQAPSRVTIIPKGQGVTTRVMERRQPVQIHDITTARDYDSPIRQSLVEAGHRALLGVPLLSEDEVIGVLAVTRKTPGAFEPETVRLLSTFATQSALAIQNARLFLEIEDKSRQLEIASQHKSEFLANMSHELRTPLNAIIGYSEMLKEDARDLGQQRFADDLQRINDSARHLLSLINDILDLSKVEAGRMELDLADFDLPQAIDDALVLMRERAGRRGITVERHIDARLGQIRADERKVKQVLLNLLSNAVKFTPEGGWINVRAGVVETTAEISVTDTGIGIALDDQAAVFEEFRQVGTAS